MEFDGAFCKIFKFLVDGFYSFFLVNVSKTVEKMIHKRKNRGHQMSKVIKSRQSYSNGHMPYHCSFYYEAWSLMHDMACKFVHAVAETIRANILNPGVS